MDYLLKLKFDELPRSLNVTLRSHFHLRSKENHRWYDLVYFMTRGKTPLKPLEKCHIKITRSSYRMLDWDSVVASIKPVVDGLVRAGIMIDDTYKVTGPWEVDQKFLQKKQGKLLEVEISGTH